MGNDPECIYVEGDSSCRKCKADRKKCGWTRSGTTGEVEEPEKKRRTDAARKAAVDERTDDGSVEVVVESRKARASRQVGAGTKTKEVAEGSVAGKLIAKQSDWLY